MTSYHLEVFNTLLHIPPQVCPRFRYPTYLQIRKQTRATFSDRFLTSRLLTQPPNSTVLYVSVMGN